MEFHIKKSRFSIKSGFKESKGADLGHSLNRDFTVLQKDSLKTTFEGEKVLLTLEPNIHAYIHTSMEGC